MTIKRGVDGLWYVELSASDAAVMGCQWVPLPLTARVDEAGAVRFCRGVPMYDGVVVVL